MVIFLSIGSLLCYIARYSNWSEDFQFAFVLAGLTLMVVSCIVLRTWVYGDKKEKIQTEQHSCVAKTVATNKDEFRQTILNLKKCGTLRLTLRNPRKSARVLISLDATNVISFVNPNLLRGLMDASSVFGSWIEGANPVDIVVPDVETAFVVLKQVGEDLEQLEIIN